MPEVAYADSVDVVNRLTFRGWEGSVEVFPPTTASRIWESCLDGSGLFTGPGGAAVTT